MNGIFGPLEGIAIRAPAGAWSLAVATVHRTVALSRSSFESLLKKEIPRLDETRNFLARSKGLRFARLRALGRSRSQQSTGLLLCPARPSNPFLKKKFPVSMRREISWPARRDSNPRSSESESAALSSCATSGIIRHFTIHQNAPNVKCGARFSVVLNRLYYLALAVFAVGRHA